MSRRPDPNYFCVGGDFSEGLDTLFRWQVTAPDSGTWTADDAINGVATFLPSDSSVGNNDEIYLASQQEALLFKAGRPIYASCRLQFVEAATPNNQANVIFGLANAVGANMLIDNGGGPRASGSVCCIYKRDGGVKWRVHSRDYWDFREHETDETAGVLNSTDTIDGQIVTTTPWQMLEMWITDPAPDYVPKNRIVLASFAVNGRRLPFVHELPVLNATEMQLFVGVKNGTTTQETLKVNWLYADQARDWGGTGAFVPGMGVPAKLGVS